MRYTQPQSGPAQIDWSNPLTRGLIGAFVPGLPVNLVDRVSILNIYTGTAPTIGVRKAGKVVSASAYGYPAPANASAPEALLFDSHVLTAFVVASQDASSNSEYALTRSNGSSAPSWGIGLHSGTNNGPYAQIGSFNFSPISGSSFGTAPQTAAVTGDGSNAVVYFNGAQFATGTYTPPTNQYSNGRQLIFGSLSGTGGQQQIRPALGLVWNRPLTAAEIRQISDNPWQLIKSPQRVLRVATGGTSANANPSGVSVSALVGSAIASAGATASPSGVSASSAIGTTAASGGASASSLGVSAVSAVGSITANGGAGASPAGVAVIASVGTAAVSAGATVAAPAGVSASASVGTVTATGAGAGTAAPAGVSAAASVGSVSVTGGAAVSPAGVAATAAVGQAVASAGTAGIASPAGVGAAASVGSVNVSAGASAAPVGVAAMATIGDVIAAGSIFVGGAAYPVGVSAYGMVGTVSASAGIAAQYPLAGQSMSYPLAGQQQARPLAGQRQTYPLEGRV
jgi:hypothetical protein